MAHGIYYKGGGGGGNYSILDTINTLGGGPRWSACSLVNQWGWGGHSLTCGSAFFQRYQFEILTQFSSINNLPKK